jgi:predicted dehydrogenase
MNNEFVMVGYGSIGRRHYKNLMKLGLECVAIADPIAPEANYEDARKCLGERAKDNLVVIASPTEFHLEHLDMADYYKAKAIYLEKPPHYNYQELANFVERHNPKCAVGFNYRFHPAIQMLKSSIKGSPAARLIMLAYDDVENWPGWSEDSWLNCKYGGALFTSASHSIDTALYLLGSVESVECRLGYRGDTVWSVDLTLYHDCGAMTGIIIRWRGPKHSSISYSDKKIMASYNMQLNNEHMHYDCMKAFLDYVNEEESEISTLAQSLEVMRIIDYSHDF